MSTEKIGNSILGYDSPSGMSSRKRKELELKVKEEVTKKKRKDEEEEKLPKLAIPGDAPPEPIPGVANWAEMIGEKSKDVHVEEHYRKKPRKKKEKDVLEIF
jgi:hypothetical protein